SDATRMFDLLAQKRLIQVCDNGAEDVRIYSADVLGSSVATLAMTADYRVFTSYVLRRQYVWRDEFDATHTDGAATDPIHNLGWLKSTALPPARNTMTFQLEFYTRPDLRIQDGDTIRVTFDGGSSAVTFFAKVTEEYEPGSKSLPEWRLKLEANPIFNNSEGSPLPATVAGSGNYIPINTSRFDGVLDQYDSNVQTAFERLDDHHPGGYVREQLGAARTIYVRKEIGTCTIDNGANAYVHATAHGLLDDDPVVFRTTGTLPSPLTPGTVYYVNHTGDADQFRVALTPDGASIDTTSAGSGTHYFATGNNSNDGTAADRGHALLTIQKAIDIALTLDLSIYSVTIQLANSLYTESPSCQRYVGAGPVVIQGNTGTPTNVKLTGTITLERYAGRWDITGIYMVPAGHAIVVYTGAMLNLGTVDFGAAGASHITVFGGFAQLLTNYTISGSPGAFGSHINAKNGYVVEQNITVTFSNTPNWPWAYVYASHLSFVDAGGCTYSGASTGSRYNADYNSAIQTYGAGATYFPGNAAGTTATGGQYN
ncbi:MAG TPA: hypothetical protein VIU38_04075, partial [Anaerolineales bacterium]